MADKRDKSADKSRDEFTDRSSGGRGHGLPAEFPKDPRELLGGYATGTLTQRELQYLMNAALEDQELFDELQDEVALKQALDAPGVRQRLLAKLDAEQTQPARATAAEAETAGKSGWFRWQWGAVGLAVTGLAVLTFLLLAPPPQNTELAQNTAQRELQAAAQLEAPRAPEPRVSPAQTNAPESNEAAKASPEIPAVQPPRADAEEARARSAKDEAVIAEPAVGLTGNPATPQQPALSDKATAAAAAPP